MWSGLAGFCIYLELYSATSSGLLKDRNENCRLVLLSLILTGTTGLWLWTPFFPPKLREEKICFLSFLSLSLTLPCFFFPQAFPFLSFPSQTSWQNVSSGRKRWKMWRVLEVHLSNRVIWGVFEVQEQATKRLKKWNEILKFVVLVKNMV